METLRLGMPWDPERPRVLVAACSDGRLQEATDKFLDRALGVRQYDRLYVPGGGGGLASSGAHFLRARELRRECQFLVEAHGVEHLILLFHGPAPGGPAEAVCADYRRKHPWYRPEEGPRPAPMTEPSNFGKYLSSINLSATDAFQFPLKTLPRPKGKATQVIYTVYDLPRPDASPHDVAFDADGNAWYSDFNSQYFGKLDVKTGKVVEYSPPLRRSGQIAQGGLQIDLDKQGRVYYGNMSQLQIVRLDPKTGKMETFQLPTAESTWGDGHLTMIDPAHMDVDGKLWFNIAFDTGESGGTWRVDLAKNEWTPIKYPQGSPSARAYDVIADSHNNAWGMQMTNDKLWKTDAKTLQTTWYDFPTKGAGCRRGHMDSQDRVWCGVFNGNRLAMFDTKTLKFTEWTMPTEWTRPYDAQYDERAYAWTAGMDNDRAVRLNVATGEFTEYLLPHQTNVRHVEVQKSGPLSSLWLGDQHGNTLIRIEPLVP